ncbi:MAG: hypothetical protein LBD13_01800 [Spirochaetaceae bacterium]|nr:hypothetical protein [Spirochaetaceae bacterium]
MRIHPRVARIHLRAVRIPLRAAWIHLRVARIHLRAMRIHLRAARIPLRAVKAPLCSVMSAALRLRFLKRIWGNQFPQTPHKRFLRRALPPALPPYVRALRIHPRAVRIPPCAMKAPLCSVMSAALRVRFLKRIWGNQFPQAPHKGYLPRVLSPATSAEAPLVGCD